MTGNNEMVLNEATMMEIVQFWLNNKFLNKDEHSPHVTSFSQKTPCEFRVCLSAEKKKAA